MEKAYAGIYGDSYAALNGGYAQNVLPMETGGTAGGNVFSTESSYISAIQSPTTLLTLASWSTNYGFVASHDYAVISVSGTGSTALFQLYNPWGTDQPPAITWAQLTQAGDFSQDGNTIVTAVQRLGSQGSGGAALDAAGGFQSYSGGGSNSASDHAHNFDGGLADFGAERTISSTNSTDLFDTPAGLTGFTPDTGLSQFWASSDPGLNSRFWDSV